MNILITKTLALLVLYVVRISNSRQASLLKLALCSHFHVHLCLFSYLSLSKEEGKQKRLFIFFQRLLNGIDLERGGLNGDLKTQCLNFFLNDP